MKENEDLTGKKFGEVTIVGLSRIHIQPNGRKRMIWKCICSCGKEFETRTDAAKKLQSCGCKRNKDNAIRQTKHSEARSRLYNIYYSMLARCNNPKSAEYGRYGGRGVSVCNEWLNDNTSFFKWAKENGYNENDHELSLERIDVNGNYEPSNCKWIKIHDQYNNMRKTIRIADLSLAEFCRRAGLNYDKVRSIYYKTNNIVIALGFSDK